MQTIKNYELKVSRKQVKHEYVTSPEQVACLGKELIGDKAQECMLAFILDIKNRVVGYTEVAKGSIDSCGVDVRQLFRVAVALGASGIIMCHNHPSGDPTPSPDDFRLTKRVSEASKILGISLVDHVVVSDSGYYSMQSHGTLNDSMFMEL